MKIKYKFITGEIDVQEVPDNIGNYIIDSRREEANDNRKERYHCFALESLDYEGSEFGIPDFSETMFDGQEERKAQINNTFKTLTDIQKQRVLMLYSGLTMREIARREGKDIKTICESINAVREKFKKFI